MSLSRRILKGISPLVFFGFILFMGSSAGFGEMNPREKGSMRPGKNLIDLKLEKKEGSIQITILADGTISKYKSFELTGPTRLVLDIFGVESLYPQKSVSVNHSLLERIRIGSSPDKVRLVLDIPKGRVFAHKITDKGETLLVLLSTQSKEPPAPPPRVQEREKLRKGEQAAIETGAKQIEREPQEKVVQKIPKEKPAPLETIRKPLLQAPPTQKLTGKEIVQKVYDRDDGKDSYIKSEMVLIDSRANRREREMIVQMKDYGQLTKTLIRFTKPADIEGTGFLSWENKERDDDQFLYLPELRRVRRIVSSKKDRRFVNTDFTFEDMERRKVEKDDHRLLREENIIGKGCYVVESIPKKGKGSQYARLITWVIKGIYFPVRTEYYGKGIKLEKVLTQKKIELIDGIWTAMEAEMVDLKRDHRTITSIREVRYNRGMSDDMFTKRNLEKY